MPCACDRGSVMARAVAMGANEFADMRENDDLLADKTALIGAWWHARDKVTLVCRPTRFGKTLTLSMGGRFLWCLCDRDETARLFEGLEVTEDDGMMALMSRVPVVSVYLAVVRVPTYAEPGGRPVSPRCDHHPQQRDVRGACAGARRPRERAPVRSKSPARGPRPDSGQALRRRDRLPLHRAGSHPPRWHCLCRQAGARVQRCLSTFDAPSSGPARRDSRRPEPTAACPCTTQLIHSSRGWHDAW